jgi:hypothetical protein
MSGPYPHCVNEAERETLIPLEDSEHPDLVCAPAKLDCQPYCSSLIGLESISQSCLSQRPDHWLRLILLP